jgi:hypothetical protein
MPSFCLGDTIWVAFEAYFFLQIEGLDVPIDCGISMDHSTNDGGILMLQWRVEEERESEN